MDRDSFLADRYIGAAQVHPGAGVVIFNSVAVYVHGHMRVPAENALSLALFCLTERALSHLCGQTQPSWGETGQVAGKPFAPGIQLLQLQVNKLANPAEPVVVDGKTVKLVAVNCQVTLAVEFPGIM